jgi:hypothetical protein
MARAFRFGNYGIYILRERGQPHHLPHAHIKHRRRLVATVYLLTMTIQEQGERIPEGLVEELRNRQEALLALWSELNGDE